MTRQATPSRRHVLALFVSTALSAIFARRGLAGPNDQGIGGTGAAPPTDESDRGIGGTGVIGTIRKFGSIIVNDLRIAYPPDTEVRIDGQPASVSDLRIGQVVRVAADGEAGAFSTHAIAVTSEVVGPVERTRGKQLTVLGQTVSMAGLGLKSKGFKVGETVAVSGLRRNDGTIVASLVERRDGAPSRVAGPVTLASDGALKIGGLSLSGVDPALIGHRAVLLGQSEGERFVVSHGTNETALLPSTVRTLSIESYVERRGGTLALGSGFAVANTTGIDVPAGRSVRAVLTTTIGRDGGLSVERLRSDGRTYGASPSGGPTSGRGGSGTGGSNGGGSGGGARDRGETRPGGAGQRIPMDFGHGSNGSGPQGGPTSSGGFGGPGGGGFGSGPGGGFGGPGGPGGGPGGFGGGGGGRR